MKSRIRAFTLIELLVVISIVALLIAILLPALKQARIVANTVGCLSNLRQSAIGVHSYANDNRTYAPPAYGVSFGEYDLDNTWPVHLKYYMQGLGAYECPGDKNPFTKLTPAAGGHEDIEGVYSYGYNFFMGGDGVYGADGFHEKLRLIDNPTTPNDFAPGEYYSPEITPFMADHDFDVDNVRAVYFEDIRQLQWWTAFELAVGVSDIDHGGPERRNLGFLDGHAATAAVSDRISVGSGTIPGPLYDGLQFYP